MKIAYFDCSSGISGDMIIAAFLDAGLDFEYLKKELRKLKLTGYFLKKTKVKKNGFAATKFDVILSSSHERRSLKGIVDIINRSSLNKRVKDVSIRIFENIVSAEAKAHGRGKRNIHLHEIGDTDSLIDITGAAIAMDRFGIEKIYFSAVNVGSGTVKSAHGILPVPAPATAILLKGVPVYSGKDRFELTTPTGAAILKTVCSGFGELPLMKIKSIGTGAGGFELRLEPDILRVFLGESSDIRDYEKDSVVVIETNIDDMSFVGIEHIMARIFEAGALDVYFVPVYMKKSRIGILLSAITHKQNIKSIVDRIFQETTTFGVRVYGAERYKLSRIMKKIKTKYGPLNIKVGSLADKVITVSVEYKDARALARKNKVPLRRIYDSAKQKINGQLAFFA